MTGTAGELGAGDVRELCQQLSERFAVHGIRAQLFVVGGAAMALAYDQDRLTRDVDALFAPATEVRMIAAEIGAENGLAPDWLNDAVKGFLPGNDDDPRTVFESASLLVRVPSPEYLLALKLHASRDVHDLDDAAVLFDRVGYTTPEQAIELLERTYASAQLLPRHWYVADDVAGRAEARRTGPGGRYRNGP